MASFSKVKVGDKVDALFCGSATLGNAPYTDEGLTVTAVTPTEITFDNEFTIYFTDRRWRYGSSAEVVRLLALHQA